MSTPEASRPEFSRTIDVRQADGKHVTLRATEAERAALAERFGLTRIDRLDAEVTLHRRDRVVSAQGRLVADVIQPCAVSAEDLTVAIDEPLAFRFVPASADHAPDEEIEIDADDCDEIDYEGTMIDVGEAVAQSLALAIDPFLTGPDAEDARRLLGGDEAGPFAALAALRKTDD